MSIIEPSVDETTKNTQQKKSRRSLLLVLLAFALPVILAKFALEQGWLDYGVTNKGQLITHELTLEKLGLGDIDFNQNWLIVYALPSQCELHCEKTLENVHNTYVALGKEMPRVTPVALIQHDFSPQQAARITQSQWQVLPMPSQTKDIIDHAQILIVDPLGNVFLSHQIPTDNSKLSAFGKQILADMKKVLKYSRIG